MIVVALLAGFFAAHAVWSVSDGETLIPIYAYADSSGQRHLERLDAVPTSAAVESGRRRLNDNPDKAASAVLIFDGYINLPSGKTDALILEVRDYANPSEAIVMAVPYVPSSQGSKFKVLRPKVLQFPNSQDPQKFMESFWQGVADHTQGSEVWNAHIDQSQ